jgi:hypothetical protein
MVNCCLPVSGAVAQLVNKKPPQQQPDMDKKSLLFIFFIF